MKTKKIVLFNTVDDDSFDNTKAYLFEAFAEEEGWTSPDDIADSVVYHEIDENKRIEWEEFIENMGSVLSKDCYLLTGTCGRWNGPCEGGKFIRNTRDLMDCIYHLDGVKVCDENGHLYITGYHHDGSDSYEIKRLTKKGYEFADRNYFAHDRQLHKTIMQNNFYSALPRIAERIYGI